MVVLFSTVRCRFPELSVLRRFNIYCGSDGQDETTENLGSGRSVRIANYFDLCKIQEMYFEEAAVSFHARAIIVIIIVSLLDLLITALIVIRLLLTVPAAKQRKFQTSS